MMSNARTIIHSGADWSGPEIAARLDWIHRFTDRHAGVASLIAGLVTACLLFAGAPAPAQDNRPLRIVIPFPAGGSSDAQARVLAERISPLLGQPVLVDARPGGSGLIASKFVLAAPADGTTLFLTSPTVMIILPKISRVDFDPAEEFVAVSNVGANAFALGVHSSVPARDLAEFVRYAKGRPSSTLNYASGGSGTSTHLVAALLFKRAGIDLVHIPYKGGAPAVQDLLAGHVQAYFGNPQDFVSHMAGQNIRVLGVSGDQRLAEMPNVPTIAETYPGFRLVTWNGLVARKGTPPAAIERVARAVQQASKDPEYIQRMGKIGVEVLGTSAAEFAETIRRDRMLWDEAVKIANIRID